MRWVRSGMGMPDWIHVVDLDKNVLAEYQDKNIIREILSAFIIDEYEKKLFEDARITQNSYKEYPLSKIPSISRIESFSG